MAFNFSAHDSSSDNDGPTDISAWQSGAVRKSSSAPRRIPGFQAVNQPEEEDIAMQSSPEPAPSPPAAPVAQLMPSAEPMVISSGEESSSDDHDDEPRVSAPTASVPMEEGDSDDDAMNDQVLGDSPSDRIEQAAVEYHSPRYLEQSSVEDDGINLPTLAVEVEVLIPEDELDEDERAECVDLSAGGEVVRRVLKEQTDEDGMMAYAVEFEDHHTEEVSFADLLLYQNGQEALNKFESEPSPSPEPQPSVQTSRRMSSTRPLARSSRQQGFVNTVDAIDLSEPESLSEEITLDRRRSGRKRQQDQSQYFGPAESEESDDELALEAPINRKSNRKAAPVRASLQRSTRGPALDDSDRELILPDLSGDDEDDMFVLQSDLPGARKRGRPGRGSRNESDRSKRQRAGERHSARMTRHIGGMKEVDVDNIYRSDSADAAPVAPKPKPTSAKEVFKQLPRNDEFRMRHNQQCEVCTNTSNFAPLIYCQGCTLAYHKTCLGHRSNREHLVTKVDDEHFVLQCRRCVAFPRKKDNTAPDQGKCQDCFHHGAACRPFRPRKTPAQEQREREENDGVDPTYELDPSRINNYENVLFRCINCFRGFHFEHLPSRSDMMELDAEADAEQRFREYSRDWKCKECLNMPAKVSGLIAWKPTDEDNYDDAMAIDEINEDEKAYLIRWEGQSYFRACWMPGAWVWGVTAASMRKAFAKREDAKRPKMRTEEAIPEDFLRTDIVLDIKFTSIVDIRTEDIDKARIREIDKALIKYKGLTYEDAVWEKPPTPDDGDRWTDFVTAYNDWVMGRYVRPPKSSTLRSRLEKARKQDFTALEKKTQPEAVQGGELMKYQLEGLNWLYFKWYQQTNAILADEMGLGKTIQIIGFLATLVHDWNCFPFLVVVPNSTCANWRREIKRWAPSLRVVAYFGSKESRDLAYRYEMFPENSKELRCHVVVTSYDTASDDSSRKFFRSTSWQGLVVDEGQRLKNEKSQLYSALGALKAPFRALMTGTPLQNNQRELFNLLHFLDESQDVDELEEEFAELDQAKIHRLHDKIKPFFLRRTKAQVLTFLPPMAQIILPVSMSVLQKKVYRTILAKNPDLMRSIFSADQPLGKNERGSLSNVLMQLRKCLCHPFVYSNGIEERHDNTSLSHRNLVDASSKLKLLEVLLPKLQEKGHRVLIFSQFLDMLDMVEDFLDGMSLEYQRLDGSISSLQKQKRIDEFNEPNSSLFAFLLSTRAGGVGINLASADTVIILDPDFNPHQDIQALSRAHRIGQTKKVLCFQLVTRASAEEKIMQIGRKKLALDHVLIQEMDADEADETDLTSVLRHGASELFEDNGDQDIVYDSNSVERLLDRSHIEDTNPGGEKSAETQFSHARVWANDSGGLEDVALEQTEESAPDPGVWANILKERERVANEEAAAKAEALGRGRRNRNNIDYAGDGLQGADGLEISPIKKRRKSKNPDESDTDFQADDSDADSGAEDGENPDADVLDKDDEGVTKQTLGRRKPAPPTFRRAHVTQQQTGSNSGASTPHFSNDPSTPVGPQATADNMIKCMACKTQHVVGFCPLKTAGIEYCNLCGIAHFGHARVCSHITSETQVRIMLETLKTSNEPEHLVKEARRYLKGLKGNLVQLKKQKLVKEHQAREAAAAAEFQQYQQQQPPMYGQMPSFKQPPGPSQGPGYYTTYGWMG